MYAVATLISYLSHIILRLQDWSAFLCTSALDLPR